MQTSGLLLGIEILEVIRVTRTCLGKTTAALVASASLKYVYVELIRWIIKNIEDIFFVCLFLRDVFGRNLSSCVVFFFFTQASCFDEKKQKYDKFLVCGVFVWVFFLNKGDSNSCL